jgi:predicted ester cyclase
MERSDAERWVEQWAKAVESGMPGAFDALVTSDVVDISGVPGAEPFEARSRALHAAFTNVTVSVDDLVIDGSGIAWRFTLRGEHVGPFLGVEPTGRRVAIQGVNFQRLEGSRVREHWTLLDRFEWLRQLRAT